MPTKVVANATPSVRKKHSRSRTGCFTCRRRRVKCDEQKPICGRCMKGSRECNYAGQVKTPMDKSPKGSPKKEARRGSQTYHYNSQAPDYDSDSSVNFELYEAEVEDGTRNKAIALFSSVSDPSGSSCGSPQFAELPLDREMLIPDHEIRVQAPSPLCCAPSSLMVRIPPPLKSTRSGPVRFFLHYYRGSVTESDYFLYIDYGQLRQNALLALSEDFDALRYAVVAFSALIYSIKVDSAARTPAFLCYTIALKQLRVALDKFPIGKNDCHAPIATALQLAAFDGAARMMQRCSDPVQYCSTAVGRALLTWYYSLEGYICLLSADEEILPVEFRKENVRIRRQLACVEYDLLSGDGRKARLLDDIWAEILAAAPKLIKVAAGLPLLSESDGTSRVEHATYLEAMLGEFDQEILKSNSVKEVLEQVPTRNLVQTKHRKCCPPLPFDPRIFKFPLAGCLDVILKSMQAYVYYILYPVVYSALNAVPQEREDEKRINGDHAVEMCKSFAGVEISFEDDTDIPHPLFYPLVTVSMIVPPSLREWVCCKLWHLESEGRLHSEPIKRNLTAAWNSSGPVIDGFRTAETGNKRDRVVVTALGNVDWNDRGHSEEQELEDLWSHGRIGVHVA